MSPTNASNLYGNLDLLILQTVEAEGPIHGLGAMDAILARSGGTIDVEDGALYRSLHRLEAKGFLASQWRVSEKNRRAKFYSLTRAGAKELARGKAEWEEHTRAVGRVLGMGWGRSS
jgi:transcriptional regulator